MKNQFIKTLSILAILFTVIIACSSSSDIEEELEETTGTLHNAFADFDTAETDIYLQGSNVVIETTGNPNHTTPYWGSGHAKYVAPTVTSEAEMTPSLIPGYDAAASLTVSQHPSLASSTTNTSLGAIGIAVSGAAIFNDQEGNGALDQAAGSLDYTGGHIGPQEYHYHLEPRAWTNDDENLVGIISDGFFIYGRKCNSTGTYPTDLDASGGHTSTTQHTDSAEYHYHIINDLYSTTGSYIVFAGPYKGTPNAIN
ncbi:YHYH protein [Polaribacter sp. MSW13]|uniref:YHYH protein n=1 Tax=Polaribacter marinus TaxID=2916838 RepID=A0A9X2AI74_9FLAO|nr:YHYH protein [Polaribacter marinus]MCI2227832.1 YHYH protein [Polaribacter marinus]